MSKLIFVEGVLKESDMDRSPEPSKTYYAKNFIEEKDGAYGEENNETDNTNA